MFKKTIGAALALLLGAGLSVGSFSAANADSTGTGTQADPIVVASIDALPDGAVKVSGPTTNADCSVTTIYTTTVPGKDATSHTEYRYQTRVPLYGSKEVKSIKGWQFVTGSTATVHGVHIPGHWAAGDSGTFYPIPDVVINAVWGSGGVDDSVLGDGTVSLSVYGGPSVPVHYHAEKVTTDAGFTAWSDFSDWSTTDPGAASDTKNVETRSASDNNATAAVVTYYSYTDTSGSPCYTPPTVHPCATTSSIKTTNLSTWDLSQTRANGHNVLVPGALHIYTDDNSSLAKAAAYYSTNFDLKNVGDQTIAQSIDYTATTGITPGLQLSVDFDNNGTIDGYLVGESIYGNDWWTPDSTTLPGTAPETGGGFGSGRHGTINQWLSVYPDAKVKAIGYSLGSGVLGDGILHSITLGCVNYTFDVPAAVPCVVTGASYDEDASPVQTEDGLLFSGPSAPAVDRYYPATGNLQGITSNTVTYGAVGGYHAALVFEAYRNTSGPNTGYMTVSAEPYQNGWVAGQTGTFTVDQTTKVWTSKITNPAPGSQADPIALSDFALLFPNNSLISVGIHLGSNSIVGQYSLVTGVTGCLSVNDVPTVPEPQLRSVTSEPVCDANGDGQGFVTTTTYEIDPVWSDILHAYTNGDEFIKSTIQTAVETGVCPVVVTPLPPTSQDLCGVDNDTITIPDNTDQVTYTRDGNTVTAQAAPGAVFPVGDGYTQTLTWSFNFTDEACPPVPTPTPPTQPNVLAHTGPFDPTPWIVGTVLVMLLAAAGIVFAAVRKRRTSN